MIYNLESVPLDLGAYLSRFLDLIAISRKFKLVLVYLGHAMQAFSLGFFLLPVSKEIVVPRRLEVKTLRFGVISG